ncbi:MAG: hypothetical protein HFE52_07750, partial [Clostridia bacterium]|nr:hypothetical protein [Clostridia bacterium]
KILKDRHYNVKTFCNDTELNENIYSNLKKEEYIPSLRIVMSICIGLRLDKFESDDLLRLAGYVFVRTKKLDFAYSILLERSRYFSKEEIKNILKEEIRNSQQTEQYKNKEIKEIKEINKLSDDDIKKYSALRICNIILKLWGFEENHFLGSQQYT